MLSSNAIRFRRCRWYAISAARYWFRSARRTNGGSIRNRTWLQCSRPAQAERSVLADGRVRTQIILDVEHPLQRIRPNRHLPPRVHHLRPRVHQVEPVVQRDAGHLLIRLVQRRSDHVLIVDHEWRHQAATGLGCPPAAGSGPARPPACRRSARHGTNPPGPPPASSGLARRPTAGLRTLAAPARSGPGPVPLPISLQLPILRIDRLILIQLLRPNVLRLPPLFGQICLIRRQYVG